MDSTAHIIVFISYGMGFEVQAYSFSKESCTNLGNHLLYWELYQIYLSKFDIKVVAVNYFQTIPDKITARTIIV